MGSKKKMFLERLDDMLSKASAYGESIAEDIPGTRNLINELLERKSDSIDMIELGMELGMLLTKLEVRILGKRLEDLP